MATAWVAGAWYSGAWAGTVWADDGVAPPAVSNQVGGGTARPRVRGKKRWWQIGDQVYHGTQAQAEAMVDAFVAESAGKPAERPQMPAKPAPKVAAPKPETAAKVQLPQIEYEGLDWRPMYVQYVLARQLEMAMALEAAIRKRAMQDQEEDDLEVLLLTH